MLPIANSMLSQGSIYTESGPQVAQFGSIDSSPISANFKFIESRLALFESFKTQQITTNTNLTKQITDLNRTIIELQHALEVSNKKSVQN